MRNTLRIICIIAFLNFWVFWYAALILGGDAFNGRIDGGRFFVGSHGEYTEVPESVYKYSRIHVISLFVTTLAGMAAAFILGFMKDPYVTTFNTNRDKRRGFACVGIIIAIIVAEDVSGIKNLGAWLVPLILIAYALLRRQDAIRQRTGVEDSN